MYQSDGCRKIEKESTDSSNARINLKKCECMKCGCNENVKRYLSSMLCRSCYLIDKVTHYNKIKRSPVIFPQISRITNKIFIGNSDSSKDYKLLSENSITDVLIVGSYLHEFFPNNLNYKTIEIEDEIYEDISLYFKEAFQFIEKCKGRILIHCFAGNSRSPSFVIAYLMQRDKQTFEKVYKFIRNKRPSVDINSGFKEILMKFDRKLKGSDYRLVGYS